jgi:hypothetical protein
VATVENGIKENYATTTWTAEKIESEVGNALGDYSTTVQTKNLISSSITSKVDASGKTQSFGWSLTKDGFFL